MHGHRGYTLIELLVVLALLALAIGLAYPSARAASDAWAVRAARDGVAAVLAGARASALTRRGAEVLLVPDQGVVLLRAGTAPVSPRALLHLDEWRVALTSPGFTGDTIVIRYDAIGIGRLANRTLRFERGRAVAGLTVSAYGRVRAW
ncbi:MAG TPA: prepilin-type N-terminal cleavage/methylation domain-containing protein [Longimicrobiales bacterium]